MKKLFFWIFSLLVLVSLLYGGLWIFSYKYLTQEIDRIYAEAPEKGYEFLGNKPVLTNFPFIPEIFYSGGFKVTNTLILFPEARLKGFPIPGLTFTLNMPRGVAIDGIVNPDIWALDSLKADIVIPYTVPGDYMYETLSDWQQSGGRFDLRHFELKRHGLQMEGNGYLALDESLQPSLSIESKLRGHETFLDELMQAGIVKPLHAAAAIGVLNSMAQPDAETNENVVTLTVSVKNRLLSVGPLQVVRLPEIVWDRRSQPAPLQ
jgi:Uncharacterized protein conserved in bacteria (DUF2125)